MDRKERIFAYMQSKEYIPLKFDELKSMLGVPKEDEESLKSILDDLCNEGKIYITKKGRYEPVTMRQGLMQGILRCNKNGGFGFVINETDDSGDVFISQEKMLDALNSDRVLVKIDTLNKRNARAEGHIVKVLQRGNTSVIGVLKSEIGKVVLIPDNLQLYKKIIIKNEINKTEESKRVCVKITEYLPDGRVFGEVTELLGEKDEIKSYINGIVIENNIKSEFSEETIIEAETVSDTVKEDEKTTRQDIRDDEIFTIDGEDARDFDDAVSLKILDNKNYLLGVHIADVTHYVKENSALDKEAQERGTSVYLADRVIPMLPEKLSNGICSLNPDVDRLALSVFMEINQTGEVVKNSIEETIIRSKKRMTYEAVNKVLSGDAEFKEEYAPYLNTLLEMEKLAKILKDKRTKRGAIQFDFPETQIRVDGEGNPVEIGYLVRGTSNKMIEEFMLVANETVAEFAFWAELPFVYRVHESPSSEKINAFNEYISNFGLLIKGRIDKDTKIHPKSLQSVLDAVKDTENEQTVSTAMLRSLMKADYRTENLCHFGLAAKYYCHFTSPIRRYPDLMIHRVLKEYIKKGTDNLFRFKPIVELAADKSSKAEIRAEMAERDVEDLMKAVYMSEFVGENFDAVITSITGFGMFVTLENSVEGLIRLENITDDYYEYDEQRKILIGQRKKFIYQIGDKLKVTLIKTDAMLRQIDFVLASDYGKIILRERKKKFIPAKNRHKKKMRYKKR